MSETYHVFRASEGAMASQNYEHLTPGNPVVGSNDSQILANASAAVPGEREYGGLFLIIPGDAKFVHRHANGTIVKDEDEESAV